MILYLLNYQKSKWKYSQPINNNISLHTYYRSWKSKTMKTPNAGGNAQWHSKMVLWKTVWQFLTKLNILLQWDPEILFLGISPNELKTYVYRKNLHVDVYSSFIHNCPKLEAIKTSFNKQTVVHSYYGTLFSNKKKSY